MNLPKHWNCVHSTHWLQFIYKHLNFIILIAFYFHLNIAVRSGDYYLFADLDEKVELDLIHERPSAGIEDSLADKKLADKLTIEQVSRHN